MSRTLWKEAHRLARLGTRPRRFGVRTKLDECITMASIGRRDDRSVIEMTADLHYALQQAGVQRRLGFKDRARNALMYVREYRINRAYEYTL